MNSREKYLCHRFEVENDKFEWKKTLQKLNTTVFHLGFSENITVTPKYEAQSAHFNKRQYSLHCSAAHTSFHNKAKNCSHYRVSDDPTHHSAFTEAVVRDLIFYHGDIDIPRFKGDNCSGQYKSKHVFSFRRNLSAELKKVILIYFGISGHGKGLVDACSGVGGKDCLRNATILKDWFCTSVK